MTTKERAERIASLLNYGIYTETDKTNFAAVVAELDEAVREAKAEGRNDIVGCFQMRICQCTHKESGHADRKGPCERCDCLTFVLPNPYEKGYTQGCADTIHNSPMFEEGFAAALEQAAKICDSYSQFRYSADTMIEAENMAREIRSLKPTSLNSGEDTNEAR